jgi:putative tryptophan/tyrosine transport system substrate-binding protein
MRLSRRAVIAAMAAYLLLPAAPGVAQSTRPPVIGFIATELQASNRYDALKEVFRQGLRSQGYVEGVNVTFETIVEPDAARLHDTLSRKPPDLMVAGGAAALAAKAAAPALPLVFSIGFDPVAAGLAASMSRPGGNATGVTLFAATPLDAKRLEYLRMLFHDTRPIGVLHNPNWPASEEQLGALLEAARTMGQPLEISTASRIEELEPAIAGLAGRKVAGLLVMWNNDFNAFHPELARLASAYRLPAIFGWRGFATSGGLMGYSPDVLDAGREVGVYAGRILKGTKPAELPIIQPTRFKLTVNAQAAWRMGVTLPDRLLALADDVIE